MVGGYIYDEGATMVSRGFDLIDPSFIQDNMLEKPFQRQVIKMAEALGWTAYHHDTNLPPRMFDERGKLIRVRDMIGRGWPDLVLVRDVRLILAELKSKTGVFSPYQEVWRALLEVVAEGNEHVQYFEWRPTDINEIEGVLA